MACCACWRWSRTRGSGGAADLPQDVLLQLGGRPHPLRREIIAPSETRIRTLVHATDAEVLDEVIGGWLRELADAGRMEDLLTAIAIDGEMAARDRGRAGEAVRRDAAGGEGDHRPAPDPGRDHPVRQWAASLTPLPGSPPSAGTNEVAELEQAVTLFRRWDASGVGGLRRKAVVGQLNAVAESLNDHHPPVISQRLFQVTAELAQLSAPAPPATAARPLTSGQAQHDPHPPAPAARPPDSATYHQDTDLTR
jgi:hypothetical protein